MVANKQPCVIITKISFLFLQKAEKEAGNKRRQKAGDMLDTRQDIRGGRRQENCGTERQ